VTARGARAGAIGRRHRVFLIPGFFGFANLGELAYFGHVHRELEARFAARRLEATIDVVRTRPTASLRARAQRLLTTLVGADLRPDDAVHLIGHSSGGLDARFLLTPGIALGTDLDAEPVARRVESLVTVATPHGGTPVASFFAGSGGGRLLRLLSLATIYVVRSGELPLAVGLKLGALFARLDGRVGLNSSLLDQLFDQLLADFSVERRGAIGRFFSEVADDRDLLTQLTPAAMDALGAVLHDRDGVRCGSVVTMAHAPGLRAAIDAGLDATAQMTHAAYHGLYRLAAQLPHGRSAPLPRAHAVALRRAYGAVPRAGANDGLVPTRLQPWGMIVHAARADHLDVIGHFGDTSTDPPHFDWINTGTGFDRAQFGRVWDDVVAFLIDEERHEVKRNGRASARTHQQPHEAARGRRSTVRSAQRRRARPR
jgi:triacylglycerol esterase/lipase EstA (alpha/beta hydrolase family)